MTLAIVISIMSISSISLILYTNYLSTRSDREIKNIGRDSPLKEISQNLQLERAQM
jgi:hypothetical protein